MTVSPKTKAGRVPVATIETEPRREVLLETDGDSRARVVLRDEHGYSAASWFDVLPPYVVNVGVKDLNGFGWVEISSTPGGWSGYLKATYRDQDLNNLPVDITALQPTAYSRPRAKGATSELASTLTPPICQRIRTEVLHTSSASGD